MKKLLRKTVAASIALVALAVSGCVSSMHPLSDEKTSQPDTRLLGTWEFTDDEEKDKSIVVIAVKKDVPNVLEVIGEDDGEKKSLDLLTVKIGDDYYASMGEQDDDGKLKYIITKYELTGDGVINLWAMDTDFFAAAVESNELQGSVKQELFKDVTLDEPPEKLRAFIERHGAKCWSMETPINAKRVKKGD